MLDFQLTQNERMQFLWLKLKDHLGDRLALARIRNDAPMSETDTAALRGEIRTLKRLIALGGDRPVLTGDDVAPHGALSME